jgi:hypothetical protein
MIAPNSAAEPAAATTGEGFDELAVANASFFIDKLGAECGDLRGLRELSVNGIEAIPAQGEDATGRVVWNVDWQRLDATAGRERKLSVIDTGIGVTTEAMRFVINHLAVSSRDRGANFGVGAKVTAGSRKPEGLEYRSWQGGRGALIRFRGHEDGRWGLDPQTGSDGHTPASGAHSARTTIRGCCAEPATVRWTTLATSSSEQFSSTNSHGHVFTADGADAALPSLTPFDLAGAADPSR